MLALCKIVIFGKCCFTARLFLNILEFQANLVSDNQDTLGQTKTPNKCSFKEHHLHKLFIQCTNISPIFGVYFTSSCIHNSGTTYQNFINFISKCISFLRGIKFNLIKLSSKKHLIKNYQFQLYILRNGCWPFLRILTINKVKNFYIWQYVKENKSSTEKTLRT